LVSGIGDLRAFIANVAMAICVAICLIDVVEVRTVIIPGQDPIAINLPW
jgi:hypothetical protein